MTSLKNNLTYLSDGLLDNPPKTTQLPGEESEREQFQKANNYGLWLLGRQDYSQAEFRNKLLKKGYSAAVTDHVCDKLEKLNYLNDERYATMICESRRSRYGRYRIERFLLGKGVDKELISRVTELSYGEGSKDVERVQASILAQKYWNHTSVADLDSTVKERRLYGKLIRRGYSPGLSTEVILTVKQLSR